MCSAIHRATFPVLVDLHPLCTELEAVLGRFLQVI